MSARRRRVIGVQAAAVALLVLLVYVTLLRPEGGGPLRGVEAPGGAPEVNNPSASEPEDDDERGNGNGPNRGNGEGGGPSQGAGHGTAAGGGTVLAGVGAPAGLPPTPGYGGPNPSDDQYSDSVSALLRKVGSGGGIGD